MPLGHESYCQLNGSKFPAHVHGLDEGLLDLVGRCVDDADLVRFLMLARCVQLGACGRGS